MMTTLTSPRTRKQKILSLYENFVVNKEILPLDYININVTDACFLRCKYCHLWKNKKYFLTPLQLKKLLDAIAPFIEETKIRNFGFSGGETLMNPYLIELINIASSYGYKYPSIMTNGWLMDEKMAEKIALTNVNAVIFSLDSTDEKIHDWIRGKKGTYNKVIEAIEHIENKKSLSKNWLSIGINCVVSSFNLHNIIELAEWANDNKDVISHINFQAVSQTFNTPYVENWHRDPKHSSLWPVNTNLIKKVYNHLINMKTTRYNIINSVKQLKSQMNYFLYPDSISKFTICGFFKGLMIEANGNIRMCPKKSKIVANIKDPEFSSKKLKSVFPGEQKMILTCNETNCHYDLNCNYT